MSFLLLRGCIRAWSLTIWLWAVLMIAGQAWGDTIRSFIKEDFESYEDTAALRRYWTGGTAQLELLAPGGGKVALHDGADMNRHGGFSIGPDAQHQLLLSADFYDFATNMDKRVTVSLRGDGKSFDMGLVFSNNYCVRAIGFSTHTNWVSFKKPLRSVAGWHRFQAILSITNIETTLDLNADGSIDYRAQLPVVEPPGQFTQLRFGGLSARPSAGGPVLVDNLRLEVITLDNFAAVPNTAPAELSKPLSQQGPTNYPAAARWIFAALGVIIALLVGLLWIVKRSWPAKSDALVPMTSAPAETDSEGWRRRAISAEAIAARQAQILHEKVGPELAEAAKQALVQGLYNQRNALIETQRKAEQALAELEQRLAELQLPVSDRIRAYEQRIAELEKELNTRGEEMRELIQATLLLVKEKLAREREQAGPRFN